MNFLNDITKSINPNYYADLGVAERAHTEEIKTAWFRLANLHHPDKAAPSRTVDAVEFRKVPTTPLFWPID